MDSLTRQLYWKTRKRARWISYGTMGLNALAIGLIITFFVKDLPLLNQELDVSPEVAVFIVFGVVIKGLFAVFPMFVAWVIDIVMGLVIVDLKCQHCKHKLEHHEKHSGEVHNCKVRKVNFARFKLVRCNCPAFIPAEKL